MAFTNETTHYGLPQWIGSDKPTYLVDQNNAYQKIDSEIYNANVAAGEAVTTANGANATAGAASSTAADALSAAQTASTTAANALAEAQTANTNAQAAQTAAGAAQTAAQAAQEAAAGNSITNLAPAYDSTITYAIDDLVTQDGKLYKCIVAVTSPEQFDINKWDDVTTSEVYARRVAGLIFTGSHTNTIPSDTSVSKKTYVETAIASALSSIKASLSQGEYAMPTTIAYDATTFMFSTPFAIDSNTDIASLTLRASSVFIYSGITIKCLEYINGTASIVIANIATDNTVQYYDGSLDTNATALSIIYDKYKLS